MKPAQEKLPYFSAYPLKEAIDYSGSGENLPQTFLRIADTAKKVIRVRILPMSLMGKTMSSAPLKNNPSSDEGNDDNKDWFKSYE